jgi:hypothetical protein
MRLKFISKLCRTGNNIVYAFVFSYPSKMRGGGTRAVIFRYAGVVDFGADRHCWVF